MATFLALTLACCGCCASWLKPFFDEYPASAALPAKAGRLVRSDDAASRLAAERLRAEVRAANLLAENVFAGIYTDPANRNRPVTIFGATMFLFDPKKDLTSTLDSLTERYELAGLRDTDPGAMGGHQRCGAGRSNGRPAAVCGFADHGSMAVGVFTDRPPADGEAMLRELRAAIITRS